MENVKMSYDGNELVIRVDLTQDFGYSKSGKTIVVASTKGNKSLPAPHEHIKLGLNLYKYPN